MQDEKNWISVGQAAKLVGITRAAIHYHIPREHFRVKKIAGRYLIYKPLLLEYFGKDVEENSEGAVVHPDAMKERGRDESTTGRNRETE